MHIVPLCSTLRTLCSILLPALLLSGCAWFGGDDAPETNPVEQGVSEQDTPPIATGDNSRNALDWAGVYEGVLPCADCTGIRTQLTLREDLSYSLTYEYLSRNPIAFSESGRFTWSEDGSRVTLDTGGEGSRSYQVGENRLFHLDGDGERITGVLAEHYVLHKQADASDDPLIQLVDRRWLLQELRGQPVPQPGTPAAQAFLQFNRDSGTVHGFAGCNSFSGDYTLAAPTRLSFDRIAATLRACLDTDGTNREGELLQLLDQVDSFALSGNRLSLLRARMAPLAVFVAE